MFSVVHAAILFPVTVELSQEFDVTIIKIAQFDSNMLLMIACIAYVLAPLATLYGKRAISIVSTAIMMTSDAWAAKAAGSYSSLLGARMLSGVGESGFSPPPNREEFSTTSAEIAPNSSSSNEADSLIEVNKDTQGEEYYGGSSSISILQRLYAHARRQSSSKGTDGPQTHAPKPARPSIVNLYPVFEGGSSNAYGSSRSNVSSCS